MPRSILTVSALFLALVALPIPLNAQTFPISSEADQQRDESNIRDGLGSGNSREAEIQPTAGFEPTRVIDEASGNRTQNPQKPQSLLDRAPANIRKSEPNEFELYVSRMIGRPLQRFGSDLVLPEGKLAVVFLGAQFLEGFAHPVGGLVDRIDCRCLGDADAVIGLAHGIGSNHGQEDQQ